jgi:hypothetical protein
MALGESCRSEEMAMNALQKDKARAPIRPTGKKPSAKDMLARAKKRWPKTMARLGE